MTHPRLYLIRHGETDWNAEGRLLSFTDRPLNTRGEEQAAGLAETLAGVPWDRAVSSPLVRARRTAEVVLAARADAPALGIDECLREMDFGPYEGWTEAQLEADPMAVTRRRDGAQIPGVEPEEEVAERARSFLSSLDAADETTLVVGHGRMLRILIAAALGLPPSFSRSLRMRNCRPAILEPGATPLLLALNAGDPAFEVRPAFWDPAGSTRSLANGQDMADRPSLSSPLVCEHGPLPSGALSALLYDGVPAGRYGPNTEAVARLARTLRQLA